MLLQILTPQYKEDEKTIKPLLDSIAIQQNVDFNDIGVVITNDGTDVSFSKEFLNSYPFKIDYYKNEHKGVSTTRNFCLDKATADYVMFCDADDLFINNLGLQLLLNTVKKEKVDVITSDFLEELKTPDGTVYVPHKQDIIFVHGKLYNRDFLVSNNIRWADDLLIHEDSYFNTLAISMAKTKKNCDTPIYLWHWNEKSVSRNDKYYVANTYAHLIKSADKLSKDLFARDKKQEAAEMFCLNIFQTFYLMTGVFSEDEKTKDVIKNLRPLARRFYQNCSELFKLLTPIDIFRIRGNARNAAIEHGWYKETLTFNDWLKELFSDIA